MVSKINTRWFFAVAGILGVFLFATSDAFAHCDTMDGPVITEAKKALDQGDVIPVLKWVKKEAEPEIQSAFQRAVAVRSKGPEAKELADMYFLETLVRVHRAGEGAPFDGIRPAGTTTEPGIEAADKALETGAEEDLVKTVTDEIAKGIRERFAHAIEAKKHKDESVDAGRKYVEAYVVFIHYVERLHQDATSNPSHPGSGTKAGHVEEDLHGEHAQGHTERNDK